LGEAIEDRQDYAFRLQAVAHEIKTPLTAIHASSQLITEPAIPEKKKEEIAQRIHKEAGRLSGVVTTFLDVERISAGVLKLQRKQVDLSALELWVTGGSCPILLCRPQHTALIHEEVL
jgi:two-component system sensor histidine kinase CreC